MNSDRKLIIQSEGESQMRISTERLQAMLDYANKRGREEDCIRRLENRSLALDLNKKRPALRSEMAYILEAWGGDIV